MNFCVDSSSSERPAIQPENGGAIPTSTLQAFRVYPASRKDIKIFVETNHYSHSINGVKSSYCFLLLNGTEKIGAAIFGNLAMRNQYKKYSEKEEDIIELRRLCCINDTPKNTESFFIGRCLRWLKKNTQHKIILSYADLEHGHQGTIYQATNFKRIGQTPPHRVISWKGRDYHDHTIRTKYKGVLKPFATRVKAALDSGEAVYRKTKGKVIYTYALR